MSTAPQYPPQWKNWTALVIGVGAAVGTAVSSLPPNVQVPVIWVAGGLAAVYLITDRALAIVRAACGPKRNKRGQFVG
jgi:uncharacterized membrane protein